MIGLGGIMAVKKLDVKEQRFLLALARKSIEYYLKNGKQMVLDPKDVPSKRLIEDGACFVTLYKNGGLRGCIGTLEAHRPLVMDVIDNAVCSAFGDPRFPEMRGDELPLVKISISFLTPPEKFPVKDEKDLLSRLDPKKHGLIIQKGYARATFLPVVWEELPDKTEFLRHLCMKAGLNPDEWKDTRSMKFFVYEAQEFGEE